MTAIQILRLTDSVTGRVAAVRIEPECSALPVGQLLDHYVKTATADDRLLRARCVTVEWTG